MRQLFFTFMIISVTFSHSLVGVQPETETNNEASLTEGKFLFHLSELPPEDYKAGSIRRGQRSNFPSLNGLAAFSLMIDKDGLRVPHWHPNASELDFVIQGTAKIGIVSSMPVAYQQTLIARPGDLVFIPQGYFHYIENVGDDQLQMLVIFDNDSPDDLPITWGFSGLPKEVLGTTFHVNPDIFRNFYMGKDDIATKRTPSLERSSHSQVNLKATIPAK